MLPPSCGSAALLPVFVSRRLPPAKLPPWLTVGPRETWRGVLNSVTQYSDAVDMNINPARTSLLLMFVLCWAQRSDLALSDWVPQWL